MLSRSMDLSDTLILLHTLLGRSVVIHSSLKKGLVDYTRIICLSIQYLHEILL